MRNKVKGLLEDAYRRFARPEFIENDPIQIPARYSKKEDVEIAAFLTATIAWGQRKSIINSANRLMAWMDEQPFDFVVNHQPQERERFAQFVHRTFNGLDAMYFLEALQNLYRIEDGLEGAFAGDAGSHVKDRIAAFHRTFFSLPHLSRTVKHVSNTERGSSAKRLNMFLRWMVRSRKEGIDFALWKSISPSELMMPLDVHTATVSRKLGLLLRAQNDWRAVEELTASLRIFDPLDPVRYDLALFGLGVHRMVPHR